MQFQATYKLLTSTYHPFVSDGILRSSDSMERGEAVCPETVEEVKTFEAATDEEALEMAQYIGYHMAKVINPHEFNGFSECILEEVSENGRSIEIPVPGNHYADSVLRKALRGQGENHFVEIVGMNSDLLYPYDFLTEKGERKGEPDMRSPSKEAELFMEKYFPIMNEEREDVNIIPLYRQVIMLHYLEKLTKNPELKFV